MEELVSFESASRNFPIQYSLEILNEKLRSIFLKPLEGRFLGSGSDHIKELLLSEKEELKSSFCIPNLKRNEDIVLEFLNHIVENNLSVSEAICVNNQEDDAIVTANLMIETAASRLEEALGSEVSSRHNNLFKTAKGLRLCRSNFQRLATTSSQLNSSLCRLTDRLNSPMQLMESSLNACLRIGEASRFLKLIRSFCHCLHLVLVRYVKKITNVENKHTLIGTDDMFRFSASNIVEASQLHSQVHEVLVKIYNLCVDTKKELHFEYVTQTLSGLFPVLKNDFLLCSHYNRAILQYTSTLILNGLRIPDRENALTAGLALIICQKDSFLFISRLTHFIVQYVDYVKRTANVEEELKLLGQGHNPSSVPEWNALNFFREFFFSFKQSMAIFREIQHVVENIQLFYTDQLYLEYFLEVPFSDLLYENLNEKISDLKVQQYNGLCEILWVYLINVTKTHLARIFEAPPFLEQVLKVLPQIVACCVDTQNRIWLNKHILGGIAANSLHDSTRCDNVCEPLYSPDIVSSLSGFRLTEVLAPLIERYLEGVKVELSGPISLMFRKDDSKANFLKPSKSGHSVSSLPTVSDISVFVNIISLELNKVSTCAVLYCKVFSLAKQALFNFVFHLKEKNCPEEICFPEALPCKKGLTITNTHRQTAQLVYLGYSLLKSVCVTFQLKTFSPLLYSHDIKTFCKAYPATLDIFDWNVIIMDLQKEINSLVEEWFTNFNGFLNRIFFSLSSNSSDVPDQLYDNGKAKVLAFKKCGLLVQQFIQHDAQQLFGLLPRCTLDSMAREFSPQILKFCLLVLCISKTLTRDETQKLLDEITKLLSSTLELFHSNLYCNIKEIDWFCQFKLLLYEEMEFCLTKENGSLSSASLPIYDYNKRENDDVQAINKEEKQNEGFHQLRIQYLLRRLNQENKINCLRPILLPRRLLLFHLISLFKDDKTLEILELTHNTLDQVAACTKIALMIETSSDTNLRDSCRIYGSSGDSNTHALQNYIDFFLCQASASMSTEELSKEKKNILNYLKDKGKYLCEAEMIII